MSSDTFSKRYPRTAVFFELVQKADKIEQVYEDFTFYLEVIHSVPQLGKIIVNPTLTIQLRASILEQIFEKYFKATELSLMFLKLKIKKKKAKELTKTVIDFIDQYNEYKNITYGSLTVATKMSDDRIKELSNALGGMLKKTVILNEKEDEKLIGGFIVEVGGKQYDASINGKLNRINKVLSK